MGHFDETFWLDILMGYFTFGWDIWMGHLDGTFGWDILMGHIDERFWWDILMGYFDGTFLKNILMRIFWWDIVIFTRYFMVPFYGAFWWDILMRYFDCLWWPLMTVDDHWWPLMTFDDRWGGLMTIWQSLVFIVWITKSRLLKRFKKKT